MNNHNFKHALCALCFFINAAKCALDVNYSKVTSLSLKYSTNLIRSFFSARINTEHRRKSHAMLKPFSDISFMLHSDTVRERKKRCSKPCKIMTDDQNMNETSMKDVQQQQHFYSTQQVWEWLKCFRKPWFLCTICLFICFFFLAFKIDEQASKQDFR